MPAQTFKIGSLEMKFRQWTKSMLGTEGGIQVYHVSRAGLHEFLKKLLILLFWNRHSFF